jgi:hypothetical protein
LFEEEGRGTRDSIASTGGGVSRYRAAFTSSTRKCHETSYFIDMCTFEEQLRDD